MNSQRAWWLALFILTLAIFGQTFNHELLWWDDRKNICTELDLFAIWSGPFFGLYAPVTYTVWEALKWFSNQILNGGCLGWGISFHVLNVVIHFACGVLVFAILRKLGGLKETSAFLAVGIFLFHPIQVEAVAWASGARDLLSTFFGLAGLLALIHKRSFPVVALFLLSMLAKPSGVVFPLMALLFNQPRWKIILPSLIMAAGVSILAKSLQDDQLLRFTVDLWERPLLMLHSYGFYIRKLLLPFPLVADYGRSVFAIHEDPKLLAVGGFTLALVLVVALAPRLWLKPALWMIIALLPTSGILNFGFQELSTVADRFFYPAMFGAAWGLAYSVDRAPELARRFALLLLIVYSVASFMQVKVWENDESLWRHNIAINDSPVAHGNLANSLFHQGRHQEAEGHYRSALTINPRLRDAWLGFGRTLEKLNRVSEAEAQYREAIKKGEALPAVYNNLGTILYNQASPECESHWREAIRLDPLYLEPHFNLGQLFIRLKRYNDALKYLEEAQRLDPSNSMIQERLNFAKSAITRE